MIHFPFFRTALAECLGDQSDMLCFTRYDDTELAGNILVRYMQSVFLADEDYEFDKACAENNFLRFDVDQDGGFAGKMFEISCLRPSDSRIIELCHYINGICRAGRLIGITNAVAAAEKLLTNGDQIKLFGVDTTTNDIVEKPLNSINMAINLVAIYKGILPNTDSKDNSYNIRESLQRITRALEIAVTIGQQNSLLHVDENADINAQNADITGALNFLYLKRAVMTSLANNPEYLWFAIYNENEFAQRITAQYRTIAPLDFDGQNIIAAICMAGRLIGLGKALDIAGHLNQLTAEINTPFIIAMLLVAGTKQKALAAVDTNDKKIKYFTDLGYELRDAIDIKYNAQTLFQLGEIIAYRIEGVENASIHSYNPSFSFDMNDSDSDDEEKVYSPTKKLAAQ